MKSASRIGRTALLIAALAGCFPTNGYAQSQESRQSSLSSEQPPVPGSAATVSGTIVDGNGAGIQGARLELVMQRSGESHTTESDGLGRFSFEGLGPGNVKVTVKAAGMETFSSSDFVLRATEHMVLPRISLRVHVDFDVQVVASPAEVAHEQLKTLEKQRVLGILPNFYTSYFPHPAALSTGQKYDLALHAAGDSGTFLSAGAVAGIEQAENIFPGYHQGAEGYAKRFGAATADSVISRMLGSAVLPSLLHQDPRYFYKGSGSVRSRIIYALEMTVICKGDDDRNQPNYSHIGGSLASGALSNLYHAPVDRGIGLTLVQSLLDFTGRASNNLIQEFLLRKVTTNAPSAEQGGNTVP